MERILEKLTDYGTDAGLKIINVLIILFVGTKLIKLLIRIIMRTRVYNKMEPSVRSFVTSFIRISMYIVLFVTAAGIMGVPMTSIIALLGSAGVAIGLALQGGLSNIAGGLVILIFKPFKVGDYIDTHTDSGTVKDISLFYTTLITPDNKLISIPNGTLANSATVNYSHEKKRRLDINVGVSYDNDIDLVKKVLEDIINKEKRVMKEEAIFVKLTEYQDSSLTYTIRVWVNSSDYWDTKFDLLEKIKNEFDKNKISIPYPQLDVHIDK